MDKTFTKPYENGWKDLPEESTPITASILNGYDNAINTLDDRIIQLDSNKQDILTAGNNITISKDESTGKTTISSSSDSSGNYLSNENPNGTGSLSINRNEDNTIGSRSVALGSNCTASGYVSFSAGLNCNATNMYSHAEGCNTTCDGSMSHSEGAYTQASMTGSHAEGYETKALSNGCHSEGGYTEASAEYSHVEGYHTKATTSYQHVQGRYNEIDTDRKYAHIIGNGSYEDDRKNIHTVDWNGNAMYLGNVKMNGIIMEDKTTGTEYLVTIDNGAFVMTDASTLSIASYNLLEPTEEIVIPDPN